MQHNHALKDKTIAELEDALRQNEAEYELRRHEKNARDFRHYIATKNLLENAIIDKQTGPLKRRVFRALEPYSNRLAKKEWVGLQTTLTGLRSVISVRTFYADWCQILRNRKIADLPDLDQPKPKPKQFNAAA